MTILNLQTVARNFVRNATTLRRDSGISIQDMADAVGVSASTIRRIEKINRTGAIAGNYRPQLSTLVKLANAADVNPTVFITQELEVV